VETQTLAGLEAALTRRPTLDPCRWIWRDRSRLILRFLMESAATVTPTNLQL